MLVVTVAVAPGARCSRTPDVLHQPGLVGYSDSLSLARLQHPSRPTAQDGGGELYAATAGTIVALGVVLDFVLGYLTLRFPGCSEPAGTGPYVWCLPAVGGRIPVEELLFYAMGPVAIVLVYACADERWLSRYNPKDDSAGSQTDSGVAASRDRGGRRRRSPRLCSGA